MKKGEHLNQTEPYEKRIRELEALLDRLKQALITCLESRRTFIELGLQVRK